VTGGWPCRHHNSRTILLRPGRHPRWPSSGATTLTSSLLLPSTHCTMRGGIIHLCNCSAPHRWCAPSVAHASLVLLNARPSTQRRTPMASYTMTDLREEIIRHHSGEDNCTASSTTARGGEISRVATSRKTLTHMHQHMGVQSHMRHALLTLREFWEGAWRLPHTCVWWAGLTSSGPT
jgi:hypothetical protein